MSDKKSPTVLMIEDSENVLMLNKMILQREGYSVLTAKTLAEARKILLRRQAVDVVVLDILLPDGNGLDFVSELREAIQAPVLILTSRRDYEDMVKGLTGGADDYMTKPYRIEELLARIVALMSKRESGRLNLRMKRGPLELDMVANRAFLYDVDMLLSPREYTSLLYLMQNEGEKIPAERLYKMVWKLPMQGDSGAVKTTMSRLRRKLAGSGYTIRAFRGEGYCFSVEE